MVGVVQVLWFFGRYAQTTTPQEEAAKSSKLFEVCLVGSVPGCVLRSLCAKLCASFNRLVKHMSLLSIAGFEVAQTIMAFVSSSCVRYCLPPLGYDQIAT